MDLLGLGSRASREVFEVLFSSLHHLMLLVFGNHLIAIRCVGGEIL